MENLADQFARLELITRSATSFLFPKGRNYLGPILPVGIIRMACADRPIGKNGSYHQLFFVLSENVPRKFTSDFDDRYPTGIVLAPLDDNYEFLNWSPETKTLSDLATISCCSDGSMEAACIEETAGRFTYAVLFRFEREEPRPARRLPATDPFDADAYRNGGWRTAVEKQYTHYQRLGLSTLEHISAAEVGNAHRVRANWWRQRGAQAQSGKNNPLIAELAPFIVTAEENLQLALSVLGDVDRKSAYDRQLARDLARAGEEKLQEFARFTLRDKVLTPSEKNDLLNQAHELGILRERAEELILSEMTKAGAAEGNDPPVVGFAQRDSTTPIVAGSDSPRLVLAQSSFSLGTLHKGERRDCRVTIDNRGGGVLVGSIHSSHPEWLVLSQSTIDSRRHHQEVSFCINTSGLALGESYIGAVEIHSNGGRESIRVDFCIELEHAAISRFRKQMFWLGLLGGLIFGILLYSLAPDIFTANTIAEVAGLVGYIAFIVVCSKAGGWGGGIGAFLLSIIVESILKHTSMRAYSGSAWATVVSAFAYFSARRLLIARLSNNSLTKLWVAISGIGLVAAIFLVGLGLAVHLKPQSTLQTSTLPVEDKLTGSSIGSSTGIRWTHALGDRGAVFSAADSSRIEYPGLIPSEGTLEFWIKVDSGYQYANYQFKPTQDEVMIFSSDVQGGDVTWPGTTKIFVTRDGRLSIWMATVKGVNHIAATEARKTKFRFGEWHAIGVSYGKQGQYIMLDGKLVASSPGRTQTFGEAGNQQSPLDVPTIGETVSHFWDHHRYEGGFEGVLAAFRASDKQEDWNLARGISPELEERSGLESATPNAAGQIASSVPQDISGDINAAINNWREAILSNDPSRLAHCYAGTLDRYFLQINVTQDYVKQYIMKMHDRGDFVRSEQISQISLQRISDAAIEAQFIETFDSVSAGQDRQATVRTILHFTKEFGGWKISYERQLNSAPGDSPTDNATIQNTTSASDNPTESAAKTTDSSAIAPSPATHSDQMRAESGTSNTQSLESGLVAAARVAPAPSTSRVPYRALPPISPEIMIRTDADRRGTLTLFPDHIEYRDEGMGTNGGHAPYGPNPDNNFTLSCTEILGMKAYGFRPVLFRSYQVVITTRSGKYHIPTLHSQPIVQGIQNRCGVGTGDSIQKR